MSKLIIDILVGLPSSGRTTWLQTNNTPNNTFDNIGETDPDLQRFRKVVSDLNVDRISISEVQFADIKVLFQTLNLLHETVESVGREEEYRFILFHQGEAYCIRNVENQPDAANKIALIRTFSPVINQTFIFLKNKFPRFVEEVRISPVSKSALDKEPSFLDRPSAVEPTLEQDYHPDEQRKKGFSLTNFLRKAS